ncbi:hypothetical protein APHNYW_0748 [Anaplasma phagocytophilum str. ApNYW]|nr:hypothetical protein APHNYW_0748 [Anaplasma phagocytophilum str. ApNYW]
MLWRGGICFACQMPHNVLHRVNDTLILFALFLSYVINKFTVVI